MQAELQVLAPIFWEPAVHIFVFIYNSNMKKAWCDTEMRATQVTWRFHWLKKFLKEKNIFKK
jgi:hypothetical protein